ncbi:MAG: hypothetical protein H6754_06310 [Candidatus Omnitrophica bacterium]|nr:hypothetical protein [Candidatus Omnitrophota bacterium]
MKYQFVVQFPESEICFKKLGEIENDLNKMLCDEDVDGHDIGSGEINYFILTDNPLGTFRKIEEYLISKDLLKLAKIAYRGVNENIYIIVYPKTLINFEIK